MMGILIACLSVGVSDSSKAQSNKSSKIYQPWKSWSSELYREHILTGRIWSARKGIFLTPRQLADELALRDFILLGEIHDNPDHHFLQAWLIRNIAWYDRRPVIVWEMISLDQQSALAAYTDEYDAPVNRLGNALKWSSSGWPDWKFYLPLAEAAYSYRLKMVAGDARSQQIKMVSRSGITGIDPALTEELHLKIPLDRELNADLKMQLNESHCGLLPEKALENMSDVQRFRDAVMAEQMVKAGEKAGAILIAGAGHVRSDRAVPLYIKRKLPDASVASLIFVEVSSDMTFAEDAAPRSPDGNVAVDYIWFTPKPQRSDQCAELKKRSIKMDAKKN